VLFVISDQQRGMDLGHTGDSQVVTPNVDRLAAEGRRHPNACASVPVCGPNRACLLTGQYPTTHGVLANDLPLSPDAPSVGEAFRDAGYRTGYVGKWHLDGVPRDKFTPPGPRRQGFDDFWAAYNCHLDFFDGHYYRDDSEPERFHDYEPIALTDLAIEFLDAQEPDGEPFFLVVSPHPPHAPYRDVPDRYVERYDPDDIEFRPNVELTPPSSRARSPERVQVPDEAGLREMIAGYYAHIEAIDEQVGRLLEALDANGLEEDTIVTYTSDHGDMLGSHGAVKKQWPWAESTDVPLVFRWPDEIPAGTREPTPFATVDVAPTLCGLAGIEPDARIEGTDRSAGVLGAADGGPDEALIGTHVPHVAGVPEWRGLRTPRYTYARAQNGEPWVLYDNVDDPYQQRNRALDGTYRDVREALDERLDAWLERTNDPFSKAEEQLRHTGMVAPWNERERVRNPAAPDLVDTDG
jgi:arylsulfatase A-like enzyme